MNVKTNMNCDTDVKRNNIRKFASYGEARQCAFSNTNNIPFYVILGYCNESRPYWVVNSKDATKLIEAGFDWA